MYMNLSAITAVLQWTMFGVENEVPNIIHMDFRGKG
jgi:hypothetical protein